jgi:glycosyltransferase involved in cell wall biosynthesis
MDSFHDVSLVVVCCGDHPYLERCIRSCVAQTFPGRSYEVAIFHDGKTPGLTDVIGNYGKRHEITSHLVEADPGAILATVLRKATGRFILFIDPEDFISDYMVLFQTVYLYDNPASGAVTVDYWMVEADSDRKVARVDARERPILEGTMFRKDLIVKLTRGEGPPLGFEPVRLREILARNTTVGHLPVSFYRRSARAV